MCVHRQRKRRPQLLLKKLLPINLQPRLHRLTGQQMVCPRTPHQLNQLIGQLCLKPRIRALLMWVRNCGVTSGGRGCTLISKPPRHCIWCPMSAKNQLLNFIISYFGRHNFLFKTCWHLLRILCWVFKITRWFIGSTTLIFWRPTFEDQLLK